MNSNQQVLTDCNSFALEMKMKIFKMGLVPIYDNVIDGLGHRVLSCVPYESNFYFGLYNSINTYTSMGKDSLTSL